MRFSLLAAADVLRGALEPHHGSAVLEHGMDLGVEVAGVTGTRGHPALGARGSPVVAAPGETLQQRVPILGFDLVHEGRGPLEVFPLQPVEFLANVRRDGLVGLQVGDRFRVR